MKLNSTESRPIGKEKKCSVIKCNSPNCNYWLQFQQPGSKQNVHYSYQSQLCCSVFSLPKDFREKKTVTNASLHFPHPEMISFSSRRAVAALM